MNAWLFAAMGAIAAVAGSYAVGRRSGAAAVQARWDAAQAAQAIAVRDAMQRAMDVSRIVVTETVDRIRIVVEQGQTIVEKVPVYVTREADSQCVVPRGFVELHNAAAAGVELPAAAAGVVDAPSGLALSDVARTVGINYTACRADAERLIGLQAWARRVAEAAR